MNRRAFLGAIGAILAAPVVALATRFESLAPMLDISSDWLGECYQTPNGETITGLQSFGERLYVFTRTCVYEVRRAGQLTLQVAHG